MELIAFQIWSLLALVMTLIAYWFMGNVGIVCGFVSSAIWILTGLAVNTEGITKIVYFSATSSVVQTINLGISSSNVFILFALVGVYSMFIGFKSVFGYR